MDMGIDPSDFPTLPLEKEGSGRPLLDTDHSNGQALGAGSNGHFSCFTCCEGHSGSPSERQLLEELCRVATTRVASTASEVHPQLQPAGPPSKLVGKRVRWLDEEGGQLLMDSPQPAGSHSKLVRKRVRWLDGEESGQLLPGSPQHTGSPPQAHRQPPWRRKQTRAPIQT